MPVGSTYSLKWETIYLQTSLILFSAVKNASTLVLLTNSFLSSSLIWSVSSSNSFCNLASSKCISTGTVLKLSSRVAPSATEFWNVYFDMYPYLSSSAPKHANVLWSLRLIGVPVNPKKNAFGSAVRIFLPRSPSCVLWASSIKRMILSRSSITSPSFKSPNLKMVVIKIFLWWIFSSSSCFDDILSMLGISARVKSPVIWSSKSILSSTITTVGAFSTSWRRSFWAANTINHDLPEPWKCQIKPLRGPEPFIYVDRTRWTIASPPKYCW